jgi:hypothetical protein
VYNALAVVSILESDYEQDEILLWALGSGNAIGSLNSMCMN